MLLHAFSSTSSEGDRSVGKRLAVEETSYSLPGARKASTSEETSHLLTTGQFLAVGNTHRRADRAGCTGIYASGKAPLAQSSPIMVHAIAHSLQPLAKDP